MLYKLVVAVIRGCIQTIAVSKVIQYFEIRDLLEQGSVFLRI